MKYLFAGLAFLLSSCVSDPPIVNPEKTIGLPSSAFTEYWEEQKNPNVIYFAGASFEWRLGHDSIEIVSHEFTDAVSCVDDQAGKPVCEPFQWSHHFSGTYQRQESKLSTQIRFHHSEPENAPKIPALDYQAAFRVHYSPDSSQMQVSLIPGSHFLGADSAWQFRKLEHRSVNILNAEVSNDCGPTDGPETRMSFNTAACANCNPAETAPYSFYLHYEDVDKIESGNTRYAEAWRCGNQGCTDSALATVEFFKTTADSVSGRITLRNGIKRNMGLFSAPKKRQRPMCG